MQGRRKNQEDLGEGSYRIGCSETDRDIRFVGNGSATNRIIEAILCWITVVAFNTLILASWLSNLDKGQGQ